MTDKLKSLNADVYAGDILREEYRRQMDKHASLAVCAQQLRDDLERTEALQKTAEERATSLMETLVRYHGMLPPQPMDGEENRHVFVLNDPRQANTRNDDR
jgi:hypothetical protein